jgi:hypothetical protein
VAEQLTVKISADITGLDAGVRDATQTVIAFGDTLKGAFLGGFGADIASRAFGAITSSVTDAIHALAEVDKIAGQTAAVIKSTGGAAGVTADQVAALADQLERKTGIEAESIQKGQNLLLTFTNIKDAAGANNDIFSQATRIMADLATAMGGDASGAAIQLGKALNDPTQGIAALTRVGVTFTDAQKQQIKALQESGNMMSAQRIILAELKKEFGGSAEAAGATFGGALDRAKNAVDSISEAMVSAKVPMFTAALNAVADGAYAISDAITKGDIIGLINRAFGPGAKALVVGLGAALASSLAPQILNVGRQAGIMAAQYGRAIGAMVMANAPLLASVAAISFAAYPFIKNWDTVSGLFKLTWQTMVNTVTAAWRDITGGARIAFEIMSGNFKSVYSNAVAFLIGPLSRSFKALFDRLPAFVKDAVSGIDFTLPKVSFDVPGAGAAFREFQGLATSAIDTVKGGLMIAKESFTSTWSGLPGEISVIMNRYTGLARSAQGQVIRSLKDVSDAADKMGDNAKKSHEKAGKAAKEHAKDIKPTIGSYFELGKNIFEIARQAGQLAGVIKTQLRWSKVDAETLAYITSLKKLEEPLDAAVKRIKDIDSASRYWGDTSDKTAEKMGILKAAIDDARASGIDPANASLQIAKKAYDDLSASQSLATQKTFDFGTALGGISAIIGATSATFSIFGGADSPIAGVLSRVSEGINLFNTWSSAIATAGKAIEAMGGASGIASALLAGLTHPVTLVVIGVGLIVWAVHDAIKAFGGLGKTFTVIKMLGLGLAMGMSKIAEVIITGTINPIMWAWTGLVNLMKSGANVIIDVFNGVIRAINSVTFTVPDWVGGGIGGKTFGANLKELNKFATEEFKPVQIDFLASMRPEMKKLEAELAAAPQAQAWEVTNPIAEIQKILAGPAGANALMQNATDAGDEALKRMAAESYQAAIREGATVVKPETPPVVINYNGTGKWTRDDAQALGALIVNEIKTAGVR